MVGRRNTLLVTKRSLRNSEFGAGRRPRRMVQSKILDDTVGMSRREEQELNKALYASLQENRRTKSMTMVNSTSSGNSNSSIVVRSSNNSKTGSTSKSTRSSIGTSTTTASSTSSNSSKVSHSSKSSKITVSRRQSLRSVSVSPTRHLRRNDSTASSSRSDKSRHGSHSRSAAIPTATPAGSFSIDESSQDSVRSSASSHTGSKRKIHAQRKFAQGCSLPGMANCTPTRAVTPAVKMLSSKIPKTEDFLTFLCLRGSSILPPHLDFFNFSREEMACRDDGSKPVSSPGKVKQHRESTPDSSSTSSGANEEVAETAFVSTPITTGRTGSSLLAKRSAARASAGTPETARGIVSLRQGLQRKVSTSSSSSSSAQLINPSPCLSHMSGLTNTPPSRYRNKFYFTPEKSPSPSKASSIRPGEYTPPSIFSSTLRTSSMGKFSPLACHPSKFASLTLGSSADQSSSTSSSSSSSSHQGTSKRKRQASLGSSSIASKVIYANEPFPALDVCKPSRLDELDRLPPATSSPSPPPVLPSSVSSSCSNSSTSHSFQSLSQRGRQILVHSPAPSFSPTNISTNLISSSSHALFPSDDQPLIGESGLQKLSSPLSCSHSYSCTPKVVSSPVVFSHAANCFNSHSSANNFPSQCATKYHSLHACSPCNLHNVTSTHCMHSNCQAHNQFSCAHDYLQSSCGACLCQSNPPCSYHCICKKCVSPSHHCNVGKCNCSQSTEKPGGRTTHQYVCSDHDGPGAQMEHCVNFQHHGLDESESKEVESNAVHGENGNRNDGDVSIIMCGNSEDIVSEADIGEPCQDDSDSYRDERGRAMLSDMHSSMYERKPKKKEDLTSRGKGKMSQKFIVDASNHRRHRKRKVSKGREKDHRKKKFHHVKQIPKLKIRIVRQGYSDSAPGKSLDKFQQKKIHTIEETDKTSPADFQREFLKMLQSGGVKISDKTNGHQGSKTLSDENNWLTDDSGTCQTQNDQRDSKDSSSQSKKDFHPEENSLHQLGSASNANDLTVPCSNKLKVLDTVGHSKIVTNPGDTIIQADQDRSSRQASQDKKARHHLWKLFKSKSRNMRNAVRAKGWKSSTIKFSSDRAQKSLPVTDVGENILRKKKNQQDSSFSLNLDKTYNEELEPTHDSLSLRDQVIFAFSKFNRKDIIVSSIQASRGFSEDLDKVVSDVWKDESAGTKVSLDANAELVTEGGSTSCKGKPVSGSQLRHAEVTNNSLNQKNHIQLEDQEVGFISNKYELMSKDIHFDPASYKDCHIMEDNKIQTVASPVSEASALSKLAVKKWTGDSVDGKDKNTVQTNRIDKDVKRFDSVALAADEATEKQMKKSGKVCNAGTNTVYISELTSQKEKIKMNNSKDSFNMCDNETDLYYVCAKNHRNMSTQTTEGDIRIVADTNQAQIIDVDDTCDQTEETCSSSQQQRVPAQQTLSSALSYQTSHRSDGTCDTVSVISRTNQKRPAIAIETETIEIGEDTCDDVVIVETSGPQTKALVSYTGSVLDVSGLAIDLTVSSKRRRIGSGNSDSSTAGSEKSDSSTSSNHSRDGAWLSQDSSGSCSSNSERHTDHKDKHSERRDPEFIRCEEENGKKEVACKRPKTTVTINDVSNRPSANKCHSTKQTSISGDSASREQPAFQGKTSFSKRCEWSKPAQKSTSQMVTQLFVNRRQRSQAQIFPETKQKLPNTETDEGFWGPPMDELFQEYRKNGFMTMAENSHIYNEYTDPQLTQTSSYVKSKDISPSEMRKDWPNRNDEKGKKDSGDPRKDAIVLHSYGSLNTGQGFAMVNGQLQECEILDVRKLPSESSSISVSRSLNGKSTGLAQNSQSPSRKVSQKAVTKRTSHRKAWLGPRDRKNVLKKQMGLRISRRSHHSEQFAAATGGFNHLNVPNEMCNSCLCDTAHYPCLHLSRKFEQFKISKSHHHHHPPTASHQEPDASEYSQFMIRPNKSHTRHVHTELSKNSFLACSHLSCFDPVVSCYQSTGATDMLDIQTPVLSANQNVTQSCQSHAQNVASGPPLPLGPPHCNNVPHSLQSFPVIVKENPQTQSSQVTSDKDILRSSYLSDLETNEFPLNCNSVGSGINSNQITPHVLNWTSPSSHVSGSNVCEQTEVFQHSQVSHNVSFKGNVPMANRCPQIVKHLNMHTQKSTDFGACADISTIPTNPNSVQSISECCSLPPVQEKSIATNSDNWVTSHCLQSNTQMSSMTRTNPSDSMSLSPLSDITSLVVASAISPSGTMSTASCLPVQAISSTGHPDPFMIADRGRTIEASSSCNGQAGLDSLATSSFDYQLSDDLTMVPSVGDTDSLEGNILDAIVAELKTQIAMLKEEISREHQNQLVVSGKNGTGIKKRQQSTAPNSSSANSMLSQKGPSQQSSKITETTNNHHSAYRKIKRGDMNKQTGVTEAKMSKGTADVSNRQTGIDQVVPRSYLSKTEQPGISSSDTAEDCIDLSIDSENRS